MLSKATTATTLVSGDPTTKQIRGSVVNGIECLHQRGEKKAVSKHNADLCCQQSFRKKSIKEWTVVDDTRRVLLAQILSSTH